jgi:hypothetical protein
LQTDLQTVLTLRLSVQSVPLFMNRDLLLIVLIDSCEQEGREETEEEGEGGEEGTWVPRGVCDQERGGPPRRRLPLAQVRPEGRQEQLFSKVRHLYFSHTFLVWQL